MFRTLQFGKCDISCLVSINICFTGESKLALHVMHLCQVNFEAKMDNHISYSSLVSLLDLLSSRKSYNNIYLRHHVFCILQIVAGRLVYSFLKMPYFHCLFVTEKLMKRRITQKLLLSGHPPSMVSPSQLLQH